MARHLTLDEGLFSERFPLRHFRISHGLRGHRLFELPRLLKLAQSLPSSAVEYYSGAAAVSQDPQTAPTTGLTLEDTLRNIEVAGSWVALKYAELDAEYRDLLVECVSDVRALAEAARPGIHQLESYIFISSPGSVTPYHFDPEHNFLLQIRGTKQVHTWSIEQSGIDQIALEHTYLGGHRNQRFPEQIAPLAETFVLKPGDGLHIPVHSPHWVKNGDQVSVSFSVTFRSRRIARDAAVHWLNAKLRGLGLSPRPPGDLAVRDLAKYFTARAAARTLRVLRRTGLVG